VPGRVLVLIPAYNEEQSVGAVIEGLRRTAPDFDRVVVNDGSDDETGRVVRALGERQLRLSCNVGYGRALQAGMRYGLLEGYDIIAFVDADGQHDPADVKRLVQRLSAGGAGMVIGSRFCDGRSYDSSAARRFGQQLLSRFSRMLVGQRIFDTTSGLKAMSAPACEAILEGTFMDFHMETIVGLKLRGFDIEEVPIEVRPRDHGDSMHSLASAFKYPTKTLLLTLVAALDALLSRRER